jgi:hypothetical protein
MTYLVGALSGLGAGLVYGLTGYWKAKKEDDKTEFDWKGFLWTVIPTAVIGFVAGFMNIPYEEIATGAFGLTITMIVKKLFGVATA